VARVDRAKQFLVGGLRRTQEQAATLPAGIPKDVHDLFLQVAVEVDQQVATGDHVHSRERRIAQYAVGGEDHAVAQFADDAVVAVLGPEEAPQPRLGDVGGDRLWIHTFPGHGQGALVHVGGEDQQVA
jgi:hypothetical protein